MSGDGGGEVEVGGTEALMHCRCPKATVLPDVVYNTMGRLKVRVGVGEYRESTDEDQYQLEEAFIPGFAVLDLGDVGVEGCCCLLERSSSITKSLLFAFAFMQL